MQNNRRKMLQTAVAAMAGAGAAQAQTGPVKKVHYMDGKKPAKTPLFSSAVSYGNLLFIAGIGAHVPGDIKLHTDIVLKEIERQLKNAGSSMEKVLRCTVFLADSKDFAGMNEVYTGKFGDDPPTRSTIAAAWIPANSLVEIDVIAYI